MPNLRGKMIENLLFFLSRGGSRSVEFMQRILERVEKEQFVQKGEIRDHIMMVGICNKYSLNMPVLFSQIEQAFYD